MSTSNPRLWILLACFLLHAVSPVRGALYVVKPTKKTLCFGGASCTVQWVDNGRSPLLSSIGACTVALYTGVQQIVQQLEPVDVSTTLSLTFTPNPQAGPDSNTYYVGFTSVNQTFAFQGFSPAFTLENMKGSFASPISSATASVPVPSTVQNPPGNTVVSTTTVGDTPAPTTSPASPPSDPPQTATTPTLTPTPTPTAPSPGTSATTSSSSATSQSTRTTTLSVAPSTTSPSTPTPSLPAPSNISAARRLSSIPLAGIVPLLLVLSAFAAFY